MDGFLSLIFYFAPEIIIALLVIYLVYVIFKSFNTQKKLKAFRRLRRCAIKGQRVYRDDFPELTDKEFFSCVKKD